MKCLNEKVQSQTDRVTDGSQQYFGFWPQCHAHVLELTVMLCPYRIMRINCPWNNIICKRFCTERYMYILELQIMMRTINIFCNISFNFYQILWRDHLLESSRRDDSNEWSHHSNRLRNKKVSIWKWKK